MDCPIDFYRHLTTALRVAAGFCLVMGFSATSLTSVEAAEAAGPAPTVMRAVTAPNWHATSISSMGTKRRGILRRPVFIGVGGATSLVPSYFNSYATQPINATGNAITIVSAAIEKGDASISVPVMFGASRSRTLQYNDADVQADPILPAQFGLARFDGGTQFWERIVYEVAVNNQGVPGNIPMRTGFVGFTGYTYDPATDIVTTADGVGPLNGTGKTAITGKGFGGIILGTTEASNRHFGCVGDSYTRDSDGETPAGKYPLRLFADVFERAMCDRLGSPQSLYGFVNFGVYGTGCSGYTSAQPDPRRPYYKYFSDMYEEYGQNSVANDTLATTQTSLSNLWAVFKTEGVARIWRTKYWPHVTSTDGYLTYANQTKGTLSQPGGKKVVLNDWFDAKAADGTLAGVIQCGRIRAPHDPELYRCGNQQDAWSTFVSNHPSNSAGIQMMADEGRTTMIPNPQAAPGAVVGLVVTASDTTITATWSAATHAPSDHKVEISSDAGSTWTAVRTYDPMTGHCWSGLTPGTAYKIRVTPINCKGVGVVTTADISTAAPFPATFVDLMSVSPAQVISSRRLKANYTGGAYYVRRDLDGLEAEIRFTASGDLDTAHLMAFARGGDVKVRFANDQSGNGWRQWAANDSGTTEPWPRIVVGGVLKGLNGRASCKLETDQAFRFSALTTTPPGNARSVVTVVQPDLKDCGIVGGGIGGGYTLLIGNGGTVTLTSLFGTSILSSTAAVPLAGAASLVSCTYDGTTASLWINTTAAGTATKAQVFSGTGSATLGSLKNGDNYGSMRGYLAERIVWDGTVPSAADRQAAEESATTYWINSSPASYALTVTGGAGSGNYAAGAAVTVTANTPASGYQFSGWTGATSVLANPGSATTTLTMPEAATAITATYSPMTGIAAWLAEYGLPTDGTGDGSPTAILAGDGITNLMKYALDIAPDVNGYQGRLTTGTVRVNGSEYLSLTYTRPEPAPSGVTYTPQTCADLDAWSEVSVVSVSSTVSGGLRTLVVRDSIAITAEPRRFLRLKITSF